MGLFKQVKQMRGMTHDAPQQIRMANAIGAQAQSPAAARHAAAHAQGAATLAAVPAEDPADYEPIADVSIELYVDISRGLATVGYDQSKGPEIAARHGVSPDRWETAVAGWNDRIRTSPDVASHFNALYIGRA